MKERNAATPQIERIARIIIFQKREEGKKVSTFLTGISFDPSRDVEKLHIQKYI